MFRVESECVGLDSIGTRVRVSKDASRHLCLMLNIVWSVINNIQLVHIFIFVLQHNERYVRRHTRATSRWFGFKR